MTTRPARNRCDISEDTAATRLNSNALVSVSEYERDNIAEKVRNKLYQQAPKGYWNGGIVPFGYIYDLAQKMLRPDPTEAPLLSVASLSRQPLWYR